MGIFPKNRPYIGLKKSTNGKRTSSDVILRSLQFHPELFRLPSGFVKIAIENGHV